MKIFRLPFVCSALIFCFGVCANIVSGQSSSPIQQDSTFGKLPTGRWQEWWDPGAKTDVKYHDEYRTAVQPNGAPSVTITTRKQTISDVKYDSGELSFTLVTSFPVKFSLRLAPNGESFTGTASTPKKTVDVIWRKIE